MLLLVMIVGFNCIAQPQEGKLYPESFQDMWLDLKKL